MRNLYYICLTIAVLSLMAYTIKRDQTELKAETKRMSKTFDKVETKVNNILDYAWNELKK